MKIATSRLKNDKIGGQLSLPGLTPEKGDQAHRTREIKSEQTRRERDRLFRQLASHSPRTALEVFRKGRAFLHGVPNPDIEAKVLLLFALGMSETEFLACPERRLTEREARRFWRLVEERLSGIPLAYITGRKEFWSLTFKVGPGVFIPRPETELIVETVIELAGRSEQVIVDIGTGSGNVAVALAAELPNARIIGTDVSPKALRTARMNAEANGQSRVEFFLGSGISPLKKLGLEGACDFIVSNPPYVSEKDWDGLAPEVRDHEPKRALVGGQTGFEFISRLVRGAPLYLKPGGHAIVEIGAGQADALLRLFGDHWSSVRVTDDLRGIPRVIIAVRGESR